MNKLAESSRRLCALLIGAVFLLSGFLKLMDPVGTGLIVTEYFKFFHLSGLSALSKAFGTVLALLESFTGAALVAGVWRRHAAITAMVLLGVFTIITAILWIADPKMDCGCFGEAVHLSHKASFLKNIVLDVLAIAAFIPLEDGFGPRPGKYTGFAITALLLSAFCVYSLRNIPLIDFTAYAPGAEIVEGSDTRLDICDASGEYMDYSVYDGDVLAVTVYDPEKISRKEWGNISSTLESAAGAGLMPLLVTSSAENVPFNLSEYLFTSDRKDLLTINRSNGGAIWISEGAVTAKWSLRCTPDAGHMCKMMEDGPDETLTSRTSVERTAAQALLLGCFALLTLL